MDSMRIRRSSSWERLLCRCFGHNMTQGLKYHGASKQGSSNVCQRCGMYEVVEEQRAGQSLSIKTVPNA